MSDVERKAYEEQVANGGPVADGSAADQGPAPEGARPKDAGDGHGTPASAPGAPAAAPSQASAADEDALRGDVDELVAVAAQRDEYLALAQRTQADFENYRKRAAREAELAQGRGVAKLAKELLPALDNLDRALKAVSEDESQLVEGIKLVHSDLLSALQRVGVEPFSPQGEPFDPQVHEAVAQQPVEGVESGTVAEVFQQGFRLGDSVLRPARVLVAA